MLPDHYTYVYIVISIHSNISEYDIFSSHKNQTLANVPETQDDSGRDVNSTYTQVDIEDISKHESEHIIEDISKHESEHITSTPRTLTISFLQKKISP